MELKKELNNFYNEKEKNIKREKKSLRVYLFKFKKKKQK